MDFFGRTSLAKEKLDNKLDRKGLLAHRPAHLLPSVAGTQAIGCLELQLVADDLVSQLDFLQVA